tara:strand:- start:180 stop:542 length:363 start_codon:yes stop_codon:yes gene_type:complete
MTETLTSEQAEKVIGEYTKYGLEHANYSMEVSRCEIFLQKQKDLNLGHSESTGSVAKDKALANSHNNLAEIQAQLIEAQQKRDVALIKRNSYKMKFEKWKTDSFEKSNQEYFEKKVYNKT